ncbi:MULTISPECIES: FitA-like ribbon-helix-helix domain-containing protein [Nitrospirillum]|uniref:Plasmid stability protein n=1 Tax=Nitrospirillum amazonense TaxID=28077 RepID=A0A560GAC0_9PROT|nr:hypothetical protein [Nitrospirillum amazonense]MEC4591253.1 hypothetical protein [Nitrospirillum amazonense]TWB30759.1 plasmid stability protein [Nitrospirillum amazonense]
MAQLLVRQVDDEIVTALKARASAHGRSVEAEHRAILEQVLRPTAGDFAQRAAEFRRQTAGRTPIDTAALIREARDER